MYKVLKNDKEYKYHKNFSKIKCSIFHLENIDAIIWLSTKHNDANLNKGMNFADRMQTLRNSFNIFKKSFKVSDTVHYFQWKFNNLHIVYPKLSTTIDYSILTSDQIKIIKNNKLKISATSEIKMFQTAYTSADICFQVVRYEPSLWNKLKSLMMTTSKENLNKSSQMSDFLANGEVVLEETIDDYLSKTNLKKYSQFLHLLKDRKQSLNFKDFIIENIETYKKLFEEKEFKMLFEYDKNDKSARNNAFNNELFQKCFQLYSQNKKDLKNFDEILEKILPKKEIVLSTQEVFDSTKSFKVENVFSIFVKCDLIDLAQYFFKLNIKLNPKLIVWDTPYNIFKEEQYDPRISEEDYLTIFKQIASILKLKESFIWLVLFFHLKDYDRISKGLIKSELIKDINEIKNRVFVYSNKKPKKTSGGLASLYKNHEDFLVIGLGNQKIIPKKDSNIEQSSVVFVKTCNHKSKSENNEIINKGEKGAYIGGAYESLIKQFTSEGDLILDLGCGPGSGSVMAASLGRNCISFERNEKQYSFATKNFEERVSKLKQNFIEFNKKKIKEELNSDLDDDLSEDKSNKSENSDGERNEEIIDNLPLTPIKAKTTTSSENSLQEIESKCYICNSNQKIFVCPICKSKVCSNTKASKGKKNVVYTCCWKEKKKDRLICDNCGECSFEKCTSYFTRFEFYTCDGEMDKSICEEKSCKAHNTNKVGDKFFCENCMPSN